jgi:2-polyprenyl-3-methyl-5-hydroxy-6-metoxy-1,4-benzoquinol methylase
MKLYGNGKIVDTLRKIEYLSPPAEVRMSDRWFEIASIDHFWIRRRFQVLQRLAGRLIATAGEIAEIGCGHGLLQKQIEDAYNREVAGFDLNENALKQNISRHSPVYCYDILCKNSALRSLYDVLFLFDVLEHISDDGAFLKAALFHLKPGGKLIVNVPAGQWVYSQYDIAAGHVRRYSLRTLRESIQCSGFSMLQSTYWGFPLVPVLLARKVWLMGMRDNRTIITAGFEPGRPSINRALGILSRCETIPQSLIGTSLMAVFQHQGANNQEKGATASFIEGG